VSLPDHPPVLVENAASLERLLAELERHERIAFDTEADSFFNYREKVCLIQVTAGEVDYLVDPLAKLDLTGIGRVLADPKRIKVFHDGEYDILILKRDFGFRFAGLFDTRVAAAALGYPNPGLASVIKERFGFELDKTMQRSDWSRRPLSERQIRYARYDTRFLIPLMEAFSAELDRKGRRRVVEGECRRLELIEPPSSVFDPDEFVNVKGARSLSPQGRQSLRELFALREALAEELNLPPFKVLSNASLLGIARGDPRSEKELSRIEGLSSRQLRRLGARVLAALERARKLGPMQALPVLPRRDGTSGLTDHEIDLHERLKAWRKRRAEEQGIDASLILNRHVLLRLAREKPASAKDLARIEGLLDWQMEELGREILAEINAEPSNEHKQASRRKPRRGPPKPPKGRPG
jgi:ribonuclease D